MFLRVCKQLILLQLFAVFAHAQVTLSGVVYTDLGVSNIGAGKSVSVSVNGAPVSATVSTNVSGAYSIPAVSAVAGDILAVFLDDEAENGVTVTVSDGSNLGGLDIYQDNLIVREDNGGALSNAQLDTANNSADSDITAVYSTSGSTLTVSNIFLAGSYTPGAETINVTGDWNSSAGSFDSTGSIIIFNGSGAQTVLSSGKTFSGFQINKSSGTLTFTDNTRVSGDFTYATGTVDLGTTTFTFTSGLNLTSNSLTFFDLEVDAGASEVRPSDAVSVTNNLTATSGTLNLASRDVTVGGTLSVLDGATVQVRGNESFSFGAVSFTSDSNLNYIFCAATTVLTPFGNTFGNVMVQILEGRLCYLPDNAVNIQGQLNTVGGILVADDDKTLSLGSLIVGSGARLQSFGQAQFVLGGTAQIVGELLFNSAGGGSGDADLITIRSSDPGVRRVWSGAGLISVIDVDVQDQDAAAEIFAIDSTDSGNNLNWTFSSGISVSGRVFSDSGVTPLGVGKTISIVNEIGTILASTATDGSSNFLFNNVPATNTEVFAVFIDDEVENGVAMFASDGQTGATSIDIFQDYLIATGGNDIDLIRDLTRSDDSDLTDILTVKTLTEFEVNDGVTFLVDTGTNFIVNKGLLLGTSGTSTGLVINGSIRRVWPNNETEIFGDLEINGSFETDREVRLHGDLTNTGTFTFSNSLRLRGTNQTIDDSSTVYPVVISETQAKTITIVGNLNVSDDFRFSADTVLNGGTMSVQDDVTDSFTNSSLTGTATIEFSGSDRQDIIPGSTFDIDLRVNTTGTEIVYLNADVNIASSDLIIQEGGFYTRNNTLAVGGSFIVEDGGELKVDGRNAYTVPTLQVGSTFTYQNGDSGNISANSAISSYYNLTVNLFGGGTITLPDSDLQIVDTLRVIFGSVAADDDKEISVGNAFQIQPNGNFTSAGAGNIVLGNTLTNSGTFLLNGSGVGISTVDSIQVRSSVSGVQRTWNGGGTFTLTDVDIQDQNTIPTIRVLSGTDNGNNTNFAFDPVLSGTVYGVDRSTGLGSGKTISVSVNGAAVAASSDTDGGSNYILPDVNLLPGDILTLFLDDETEKGVVVTEIDAASALSIDIYEDHLAVRHDNGDTLSVSDISLADNSGDTDISDIYTVGATLDIGPNTLLVEGSFTPADEVSANDIVIEGTFSPESNTTFVSQNWYGLSGTFISGTGQVHFLGGAGSNILAEDDNFNDVYFDDSGGSKTYTLGSNLSVSNDLTLVDGVIDTDDTNDYSVTIGRDLVMSGGAFAANDSTFTIARNLTLDGTEDGSQFLRATLQMTGSGVLAHTNFSFGLLEVGSLIGAQGGNTTNLSSSVSARSSVTLGTGALTSGPVVVLEVEGPLTVDPLTTMSVDTIRFLGSGRLVPSIPNGYNSTLVCLSGCTQTGSVTITSPHSLIVGVTSAGWDTDGFDLSVGGDVTIQGADSTTSRTLDFEDSTVSIGGDLLVTALTTGTVQADINSSNSTLVFDGTGTQDITLVGSTLNDIQINNSAAADSVSFLDSATINGQLDVQDGQVVFGAGDLAILDTLSTGVAISLAGGSSLGNTGTGSLTLGGGVNNAGSIVFNSSDDVGNSIQILSNTPGMQRTWQGAGSFTFEDVTVRDMNTTGVINVTSGTNLGGNLNWIFDGAILSGGSLSLSESTATLGSAATISFTTSNPIPSDGRLSVVFPVGFDISGITGATSSDLSGTLSIESITAQTLVLSRVGGGSHTGIVSDLVISGLINPSASGTTGSFTVETQDNVGTSIDVGSAPGVLILPNTYNLSGIVRDSDGNTLSGVLVNAGSIGNTTTNSGGVFDFGAITAGTNYTIVYSLANYVFNNSVGTITADTNLNVVGSLGGATVTGIVTFSNLDRTPLADVTVTDGSVSTITASDGSYTLLGVNNPVSIESNGFVFEDPTTGFSSSTSSSASFVGTPALLPTSYSAWNTFLGMTSILELSNSSESQITLTVELLEANGDTVSVVGVSLSPGEKRDIILNDILGRVDEYGVVKVTSPTVSYTGKVTQYGRNLDFSYTIDLSSGMLGKSSVPYNSYQPSLQPGDEDFLVPNWLTIINLSSSIQGYQIRRYNSSGEQLRDDVFYLPAMGRLDVQGGHEAGEGAGHHSVEPLDSSSRYLAFLTRYGDIGTEATSLTGHYFATNLIAQQPAMTKQFLPVSSSNNGSTWLEITNISDYLEEVSLEVLASNGDQAHNETFGLSAYSQRHFDVSAILDGPGYVRITTKSGRQVITQSLTYYNLENSSVGALNNLASGEVFGDKATGSFNSFLETGNTLSLSNVSDNFQSVVVTIEGESNSYSLSPNQTILVPLTSPAEIDQYGSVEIQVSDYGAVLTEVVRAGGAENSDATPGFVTSDLPH